MNRKKSTSIPGIYLITSTANGKVYVGQARNITMRWYHHRYHLIRGKHGNPYLQRAWDKLGSEAFVFSVAVDLSTVPKSSLPAELNRQEALVFALHPLTYNLLHPGVAGPEVQPETRAKMAACKRTMWAKIRENPQGMADMIERSHAWRRTPEGRAAFGARVKALWETPNYRSVLLAVGKEKWERPQYRENHRADLKVKWADPEKREQRIAGLKAAWADPEIRASRLEAIRIGQGLAMADPNGKMRKRPEKRWADPDARARQAAKSVETWADPEIKARRCAALKAAWVIRRARSSPAPAP